MKRIIVFSVAVLILLFSLCGCKEPENSKNGNNVIPQKGTVLDTQI